MSKIIKQLNKKLALSNEELYPRTVLRGFVLNKKKNVFSDNSLFFTTLPGNNAEILAEVQNVRYLKFQNASFAPIKFLHGINNFQTRFDYLIFFFNKILCSLTLLKSEHTHIFLLKPLKSGFRCIFIGIFGFVFLKTLDSICLQFEICTKNLLNSKKLCFLNCIANSFLKLWIKLPSKVAYEFVYVPCVKRKKFSKKSKAFKISNSLNVILLLKD